MKKYPNTKKGGNCMTKQYREELAFFDNPDHFSDIVNALLHHGKQIVKPEMVKECDDPLYSIIDNMIHFSQKLSVIKLVNDGTKEDVVIILFDGENGYFTVLSHPNNFIH